MDANDKAVVAQSGSVEVAAPTEPPVKLGGRPPNNTLPAVIVFAAAIFTSAFLLFAIQPLVSKQILPWFGGSAAVWGTCLVFFQTLLLAGYAYAHGANLWLRPRPQAALHLALLAVAGGMVLLTGVLPSERWFVRGGEQPVAQILLMLGLSVGLPYFVLAATGPLLQAWFGRVSKRTPYRLYALSNAGSLLALVSYPFLVEPLFGLPQQAGLWAGGFIAFSLLCGYAAFLASHAGEMSSSEPSANEPSEPPTARQFFAWLAWPALACVALFATTSHVSTDIAATPFLWVVPLALYLLTFIIAFDRPHWYRPVLFALVTLAAIYGAALVHKERVGVISIDDCGTPGRLYQLVAQDAKSAAEPSADTSLRFRIGPRGFLVLNFAAMFGIAMLSHGELVRARPHPKFLTSFYLMIAAGGALGGAFTAMAAPRLFATYFEWQLSIFMGCLVAIGIVLRALVSSLLNEDRPEPSIRRYLMLPPIAALVFLPLAVVLLDLTEFLQPRDDGILVRQRNFFGALSVREREPSNPLAHNYVLQHGAITHGAQFAHPSRRRQPTTYFSPQSGVGRTLDYLHRERAGGRLAIGVIGLGIGTLAAYAEAGDKLTFYELNPAVVEIAEDARWFSFLSDCRRRGGQIDLKLGDARRTLGRDIVEHAHSRFDVLVLDAFSGDSIPMHLLTVEAFEINLARLRESGSIAVHISNRFLDLSPVVRGIADHFGLSFVRIRNPRDPARAIYSADWIILSRNEELISELSQYAYVPNKPVQPNILWTDERSSLLDVLK